MTDYVYHNRKFDYLNTVQVKPSMTDDEREFISDMSYLRDLMEDIAIVQEFMGGEVKPIPKHLLREREIIEAELARIEVR